MNTVGRAAILIMALALAGCGGAPTVPPDHYYRLAVAPHGTEATPLLPGTVSVQPLTGAGLLQERAILFTAAGHLHEMRQHDYHYWHEAPPQMIQTALASYLRARQVAESVVTPELRVPADYEILGRIKRLEQVIAKPNRVVLELELALVSTGQVELLLSQTYRADLDAEQNIEGAVIAMKQALGAVFGDFVTDLRNLGQHTLEADR